jgi:hypothetical protein
VDVGEADSNALNFVASAMATLPALVWAVLARAVIRGAGDVRRPLVATYLATGAIILVGVGAAAMALLGIVVIVQVAFALSTGLLGWSVGFAWLGGGFAISLLLVAFGLGLADTSARGSEAELRPTPADEGPAWPAPGGEVPVWPEPRRDQPA